MRYFNDTEKEVIDYICSADPNLTVSTVKELFEVKCNCSMMWKNDYLTIFVDNPSSAQTIVTRILNIICILEYLKSEGLIYLFGNIKESHCLLNEKHGHTDMAQGCDFIKTEPYEIIPSIDVKYNANDATIALKPYNLSKDISKKIFDFFNCTFLCSATLRHIKNQDFKDDATIQYEENRKQTKKAIKISLGIGIGSILVGVIVGCLTYCQNERHHQESLSQTQKIVIVHDTIMPSDQPGNRTVNNMLPKPTNDSLKSTKTKSK